MFHVTLFCLVGLFPPLFSRYHQAFYWPSFVLFFFDLISYKNIWPFIATFVPSLRKKNQELDKNAILQIILIKTLYYELFCCLLQWLNLITEELSFIFKELDWCLGEANSILGKTVKNPNLHLTSSRVRIFLP